MKRTIFSLVAKIVVVIILVGNLTGVDVFARDKEREDGNVEQARTQTPTDDSGVVFNKIDTRSNKTKSIYLETVGLEKIRQVSKRKGEYVEGEILVKYKNSRINLQTVSGRASALNFIRTKSLEKREDLRKNNISVLRIKDTKTVEQKITELKNDPNVEYAQPNFQYYPTDINTDDTDRDLLWGLDNTGQTVGGTYTTNNPGSTDKDIDAPEAWAINEGGNPSILVAVIDSGVAYNHPDLVANMWDGINCKDENGVVIVGGCNHGYDYEDSDNIPLPTTSSHGTHIAGTIAAAKNNGQGIIGVAPQAKIMALKTSLTTVENVKAINFAKQNGAKVINASWGSYSTSAEHYDIAMYDAIKDFPGLFVVAAGNATYNHDDGVDAHKSYPDGFKITTSIGPGLDNIIVVAATDQSDALASFSDYGATSVDVGAPGTNIYSTVADPSVISEDFNSVTTPNLPSDWVKGGTNNKWATYVLGGAWGNVLYGQVPSFPYDNNANTTITSPSYNLGSNISGATMDFRTRCDTEYTGSVTGDFYDYMALEYSSDGVVFNEIIKWDEPFLDLLNDDSNPSGGAVYYFEGLPIASQYLSNNFKFRFRWITDSSVNNYDGCSVDNIKITKFSDGSDEQYGYKNGTSMATPHVVGFAALVWGYKPELSYTEVKNTILSTGDDLASLAGKTVTGKRINAFNALKTLSETEVSSNIIEDTTWTLANSPYHITETVSVYPGITLTIEPGVIVTADAEKYLQIAGTLIARGNENNLITFTSHEVGGNWGGIKFIDSAEDAQIDENYNYISGSIIEYADINSGLAWDCIRIEGASPFISHSDVHNCANGIFIYNFNYPSSSNAVIYSNTIRDIPTGYGIQQTNRGSDTGLVKIINNEISNTGTGIVSRNGQGPQILGNTITNNKRGISLESSNGFLVENNVIAIPSTSQETSIGMNITSNSIGTVQQNSLSNDATVHPSNSALNIHNSNITVRFNTITANSASTIRVNCLGVINCSVIDSNNIYNTAVGGYAIWNWGSVNINALDNYWGTTNSSEINSKIYDFYDDPSLGKVIYNPFSLAEISSKAITNFSFPEGSGTVNEDAKTIAVTVPFGTNVTALVPTITITGASVSPISGVAQNFTSPITYTVTAADSSTQAYAVTVTIAPATNHTISGTIKYYDEVKVVPGASVILEDGDGMQIATTTTDANGVYQFTGVTHAADYVVRVSKSDNAAGLTSADRIKIGRHIVGLELFDTIYKTIAGDVNNSGGLTSADRIKIGRFIVGLDANLPSGAWKFYPANAVLDVTNYLTFSQTRTYINLTSDMLDQNFVGVKMGDVNNSWNNS